MAITEGSGIRGGKGGGCALRLGSCWVEGADVMLAGCIVTGCAN